MVSETFKLVDGNGDVLGIIWVPTRWAREIAAAKQVEFRVLRDRPITSANVIDKMGEAANTASVEITKVEPGVVRMYGITLRDFERLPDCAFSPSVDYLQRNYR